MREYFNPELAPGGVVSPKPHVELIHKDITDMIIGAAISVHRALGPGLLESAYEVCLVHELMERKVAVRRQVEVPVVYDGISIDAGFRIDLVENKVVVELKAVERLAAIHEAQLNTYLRLAQLRVGLLINFNCLRLRDGIVRRVL